MNDTLDRALYYSYADIAYPPDDTERRHWHHLSDREKAAWGSVAKFTRLLVNSAAATGKTFQVIKTDAPEVDVTELLRTAKRPVI